ncbi:MAG: hypothetical protein COV66_11030 [Nitrospinae bacterium CG11_big_fil_rev_8_21_14_0_20_45_15]|nr:MAG: hypothetical protein COV66_11030 [Nitrospinae bacterium CG11_big_fil_rev_8_21_14_0_20_45_15]
MSPDLTEEIPGFSSPDANRQPGGFAFQKLHVLDPKIDEKTAVALENHLKDLGLLPIASHSAGGSSAEVEEEFLKIIEASSRKRYLNFFLRQPFEISTEGLLGFSSGLVEKKKERTHLFSRNKNVLSGKQTSDLSNVQIVKKMETQLKPFLDMEKLLIPQLMGERVNKEDAQCLFNFIMSKLREKVPTRQWEQLSRRRHKK